MLLHRPLLLAILISCVPVAVFGAEVTHRTLFDFSDPNAAAQWQIVNDGVMGGRSSSKAEMAGNNQMRFSGNLSLANNGGFASVRSRPAGLGLKSGDVLVARVRGDGRIYTFNLYVPNRRMAFSYRVEFQTTADQWTEIRLPLDRFVATSFGRTVAGAKLNPPQVDSVGILLGDKKPGPFQIVIDWINVE